MTALLRMSYVSSAESFAYLTVPCPCSTVLNISLLSFPHTFPPTPSSYVFCMFYLIPRLPSRVLFLLHRVLSLLHPVLSLSDCLSFTHTPPTQHHYALPIRALTYPMHAFLCSVSASPCPAYTHLCLHQHNTPACLSASLPPFIV